jgi:hypothetical protein
MSSDGNRRGVAPQSSEVTGTGGWVTPPVSYVDPTRRFCDFCGRPIARRFWQVETTSGLRLFCEPAHAAMQATYPLSLEN